MVRFKVVTKSQSGHCCFEYTIVDTSKPYTIGGEQYSGMFEEVCECLEEDDARMICDALNMAHGGDK